MTEEEVERVIRDKARRMARARRERRSLWTALGKAGTMGWQIVLPLITCTLLGRALGVALASDTPTLAGIALGLTLGLSSAALTLRRSLEEEP